MAISGDMTNQCLEDLKQFVKESETIKINAGMTGKTPLVELKSRFLASVDLEDCISKMATYRTIVEQAKGIYVEEEEVEAYQEIKIGTNEELTKEKVQLTQNSLFTKETVDKYINEYEEEELIISAQVRRDTDEGR